jgi:sensor c-di-GMP phosphodiesterase-like protein
LIPWRYRTWLACVAGAIVAGTPMLAFNHWLTVLDERHGHDEVQLSARRTLTLAENRINKVVAALDDLARKGIDSCQPPNLDALRQAAFATTPIKELSVVGPDGQTLCTDLGVQLGERKVGSAQTIAVAAGEFVLELVHVGARADDMLRLRRPSGRRGRMLAALMPAEAFLPKVTNAGEPFSADVTLSMRDGTVMAALRRRSAEEQSPFVATLVSEPFGLTVTVALGRHAANVGYAAVRALGTAAAGIIALGIIGVAILFRRNRDSIADIAAAMHAGEFVPYYQPVFDINTGALRGAEVLIRWRKPDGTIVLPGAFIPRVESSGLILELTRDLMRQVRTEVGDAYRHRPSLRIGFNLAARHLVDEAVVDDVREIFEHSPIRLSQVVLEVTERQPLENLTETRRVIAGLQGIGVQIAIDDVGTGHSGLSYILKLGADIIKIDKLFIDSVGADRNSIMIIETLVDLARNLRMDVVAEGVETFDQVICLRELGIPAAQGYVFAPPLPGPLFLQLLAAIAPVPTGDDAPAQPERPAAGAASAAA